MEPSELLKLANEHEEFVLTKGTSPEKYHTVDVWAEWNGHAVKLAFVTDETAPADYRYNVTVYEADTDTQIATGNGGRSWSDAMSIVHWQELELFDWAH